MTGLVLVWLRPRLLAAVDRLFFREHVSHQQALLRTTDLVRQSRSSTEVAYRLVSQVESTFHAAPAASLFRDNATFSALSGAAVDLPAQSALVALLEEASEPLRAEPEGPQF